MQLSSRVFSRQKDNEDPHRCSYRKHRPWLTAGQRLKLDLPSSCNRDKLRTKVFKATTEEATEDTMLSVGDYTQSKRPHPVKKATPSQGGHTQEQRRSLNQWLASAGLRVFVPTWIPSPHDPMGD